MEINNAGKGDSPRPINGDNYRNNFDDIFRKTTKVEEDIKKLDSGEKDENS